jgi:glycosyltransferase involved in cell wall biosynthesis
LSRCLAALWPQLQPAVEVIVVDNCSTESLAPIRTAYPDLRVVIEAQKGAAHARNKGVAETKGDILCFLDCDCIPSDDWLAVALAASTRADLVGGRVVVFDETPPPRTGAQAFEAVFAFDNQNYVERKGFSVSANLITNRAVFAAVGPFSPGISEDLDWCRRATKGGHHLVYSDDMIVRHPSRGDWAALQRKWRRLNDESFGLMAPGYRRRLIWAGRACAMPISVIIHGIKILRSPKLCSLTERLRAFHTLLRLRLTRAGWMLAQAARDK